MSDVPDATPVPTCDFPREDSLCERCGYPLRGLPYENECPECGLKIEDSDPAKKRPGLPWQQRRSWRSLLLTWVQISREPGAAYRSLRIDHRTRWSAWPDRIYLLIIALLTGIFLWAMQLLISDFRGVVNFPAAIREQGTWLMVLFDAARVTLITSFAIIILTYIEALGVAWFSWRRGWRVSFRLAERVSCYASVGWVPAGILCNILWLWYDKRLFRGGWYPFFEDERDLLILMSVAMVTILWFEWLVWLGVRRVRYANAR